MTTWVLVVVLASGLWLPVYSFDTEAECYQMLQQWEFEPPVRGTCLPGVIEPETKPRRRRK